MTVFEAMYGNCVNASDSSECIMASLCSSNTLIQDGEFYIPSGVVGDVQTYHKETVFYNDESSSYETNISDEIYRKVNGKFIEID